MTQKCNISNFLSKFTKGFASPSRFLIELQMPPGINDSGSWLNSESTAGNLTNLGMQLNVDGAIQIACHTCTMPGRTLQYYLHSQHSAPFHIPYSQSVYDPLTFAFYADSELSQRHFFDAWQTAVININDNSLNFFIEYTQDIKIWQLDRQGNKTYGITLYAAWPSSISEVSYGYANTNQVQQITVSMSYKLWKSNNDNTNIVIF